MHPGESEWVSERASVEGARTGNPALEGVVLVGHAVCRNAASNKVPPCAPTWVVVPVKVSARGKAGPRLNRSAATSCIDARVLREAVRWDVH